MASKVSLTSHFSNDVIALHIFNLFLLLKDCIIVVLESQKAEIQLTVEKCPLKIKLDFVSLPTGSDLGTADALKHLKDKYVYCLHRSFIVSHFMQALIAESKITTIY